MDSVYMAATQAMTGHGGWPMTVFARRRASRSSPGRTSRPSRVTGCRRSARCWTGCPPLDEAPPRPPRAGPARRRGDRAGDTAAARRAARGRPAPPRGDPDRRERRQGARRLRRRAEVPAGARPRVPAAHAPHRRASSRRCELTLRKMALGGIYDQIGGGFARYSVDATWTIPHFEKMLYDNAQLARVYTHAWQLWKDPLYQRIAVETLEYLLRDMRDAGGGFHSSEDADSEGEEGKFYVLTDDEFMEIAPEAVEYYGITQDGNFEHGTNNPIAAATSRRPMRARSSSSIASERIRPGKDDKVLASWNGLAIAALAEAGAAFGRGDFIAAAREAAEFVLDDMTEGRPAPPQLPRPRADRRFPRGLRLPRRWSARVVGSHVRAPMARRGGALAATRSSSSPTREGGFYTATEHARRPPEGDRRVGDAVARRRPRARAPASRASPRRPEIAKPASMRCASRICTWNAQRRPCRRGSGPSTSMSRRRRRSRSPAPGRRIARRREHPLPPEPRDRGEHGRRSPNGSRCSRTSRRPIPRRRTCANGSCARRRRPIRKSSRVSSAESGERDAVAVDTELSPSDAARTTAPRGSPRRAGVHVEVTLDRRDRTAVRDGEDLRGGMVRGTSRAPSTRSRKCSRASPPGNVVELSRAERAPRVREPLFDLVVRQSREVADVDLAQVGFDEHGAVRDCLEMISAVSLRAGAATTRPAHRTRRARRRSRASSRPCSDSGGSAWPCHRPCAFHSDWPWRTSRSRVTQRRATRERACTARPHPRPPRRDHRSKRNVRRRDRSTTARTADRRATKMCTEASSRRRTRSTCQRRVGRRASGSSSISSSTRVERTVVESDPEPARRRSLATARADERHAPLRAPGAPSQLRRER